MEIQQQLAGMATERSPSEAELQEEEAAPSEAEMGPEEEQQTGGVGWEGRSQKGVLRVHGAQWQLW